MHYLNRKFASRLSRVGVLFLDESGQAHIGDLDYVVIANQTVASGEIAMNEIS